MVFSCQRLLSAREGEQEADHRFCGMKISSIR